MSTTLPAEADEMKAIRTDKTSRRIFHPFDIYVENER